MEGSIGTNDFDLFTFKYSGVKYSILILILNVALSKTIVLANNMVELLDYENTLNELILTGSLFYTDVEGRLDKILAESYSTCTIHFRKEKGDTKNGNLSFINENEEREFAHTFLINNVNILSRVKNMIKYRLDLVSIEWQKFNKRVRYTNYGGDTVSITDILKNLFHQSGIKIDEKSFSENQSPVKIHYITKVNDTLYTAMNYLLRRMYYDKEEGLEPSLKFLALSILEEKIYLIDLAKETTFLSEDVIAMSMFLNSIEDALSEEPMQMASLNKISKAEFFKSFEKRNFYKYDPKKNEIKDINDTFLCHKAMLNGYFNNTFKDSVVLTDKKIKLETRDAWVGGVDLWETYWNNKDNVYENMLFNLMYNDSLVIALDGSIIRNSGGFIGIRVDRDLQNLELTDGVTKEEKQIKYKKFESIWIILRVRHIIQPSRQRYKTNLVLCRNWTPVLKPDGGSCKGSCGGLTPSEENNQ